ncbi:MAG: mitochondrial fission ELM1 family protein [Pseudomonadota bacterium]
MPETWIVTDGAVGMEAQGIAVAKAVGLPYHLKRVNPTGPIRFVPTRFQHLLPPETRIDAVLPAAKLAPPWPRLVISIGRRSVPFALAISKLGGAFGVHIQDPKVPARLFDLIAAPAHDGFAAPNAVTTFGAVHSVTAERLAEASAAYEPKLSGLPRPFITVLLGGDSRAFKFPPEVGASFGGALAKLAEETGGTLLVTPSRRTSSKTLRTLAKAIENVPHQIWDGTGENPYLAFLSLADAVVVTEDSVNMVTEAAGTGKPVYVQSLPGKSKRLARFHALMREHGATRPFEGHIDTFDYAPINDTEAVAAPIRKALGLEPRG